VSAVAAQAPREGSAGVAMVVIGASLGGLDAVRLLLRNLPAEFSTPIVLVQHRMSESDGLLVELLAEQSLLRVSEPEDKDPIERGHFYVAPSDYHLLVEPGSVHLGTGPKEQHVRPAVDMLFRSAPHAYGSRVVGVSLTGMNHDGTAGLQAVQQHGGVTVVQDPSEAAWPTAILALEAPAALLLLA